MASKRRRCSVPNCSSHAQNGISLHLIPKEVRHSEEMLKAWSDGLQMGEPFPNNFRICSLHFASKYVLTPIRCEGRKSRSFLSNRAVPTIYLPESPQKYSYFKSKQTGELIKRAVRKSRKSDASNEALNESIFCAVTDNFYETQQTTSPEDYDPLCEEQKPTFYADNPYESIDSSPSDKDVKTFAERAIGEQINQYTFDDLTSFWYTKENVQAMTGIANVSTFDIMVRACENIRINEKPLMPMKDKLFLTMYKLKSNASFSDLGKLLQVSDTTARTYFADTIQLLAKLTANWIHWQTKEEALTGLPACLENFSNLRIILGSTELKTVKFRCCTCRTCPYSHDKGSHTLKVLIGVTPSGAINYLGKATTGKSSENLPDLLNKLKPGDAVMVDKELLIGDELARVGIEVIRPDFLDPAYSRTTVAKTVSIDSASIHVESKMSRLKMFKVLSDKVGISMIPYIDDIMTVLCGLSNISTPTQFDENNILLLKEEQN